MKLRALLLAGAVLLFILAVVIRESGFELMAIGLALLAGAFLVDDLGIRGPRGSRLR